MKGRNHLYFINENFRPLMKRLVSDIKRNRKLFGRGGFLALMLALYALHCIPLEGANQFPAMCTRFFACAA